MIVARGANVVDGTGAPGRAADVVFDDDTGLIVDVVEAGTGDGDVVDLDGLVLAPGFVDPHTHYDAQVLWDPDLTPSSWHGVTSVVMGNCGFGIAPTRPTHREAIARTLENVEGMSVEALTAGITWDFESFPEYLDQVEAKGPRLNVAAMVGHTPLRLYVMGDEAADRSATGAEIDQMRALLGDALDAGAVGFASSRAPAHAGAWGKPVPSRLAEVQELEALADALRERRQGTMLITRGPDYDQAEIAKLAIAIGRPVTWTALLATHGGGDVREAMERSRSLGGDVWPQIASRPVVFQVQLAEPAPLARIDAFAEVLSVPAAERARYYRDPSWRERAREQSPRQWPRVWSRIFVDETATHPELLNGPSMQQLAADRGCDPLDVLCDIALDDDLATRFRVVIANDDPDGIAYLLNDDRTLLGLSDAGAHASQMCDAVFATFMLEHWVRETGTVSLEQAVQRMTSQPAQVFGLHGRGLIAPGYAADLVAFDAAAVGVGPMERVYDLPAGADRLIADSRGIERVWVNGTLIRDGGTPTGARPGQLIRGRAT
jgi:N-acyl-D-aspartate/D-glutamate deacylase